MARAQCARRPTILVIDDLQWADQASVRLWGRLARSARQMPLLLIGMMRPVPRRDDLPALRRAVGGPDETPEPLDEWMLSWLADAAELLVSQAPQVAAELLRQGVASSPAGTRHDRLAARLADALGRVGDAAGARVQARL